jgi:hypothetical protein
MAPDLFMLLRSLVEEGKRYSHGTGSDKDMLLSLGFAVFHDIWTYDVNEKDSQGNSPPVADK